MRPKQLQQIRETPRAENALAQVLPRIGRLTSRRVKSSHNIGEIVGFAATNDSYQTRGGCAENRRDPLTPPPIPYATHAKRMFCCLGRRFSP